MIGVPSQQYRKKPTMQQTDLADPHFVDAKRIKELGNAAELPAYRTMVRCLDETSVGLNASIAAIRRRPIKTEH